MKIKIIKIAVSKLQKQILQTVAYFMLKVRKLNIFIMTNTPKLTYRFKRLSSEF